MIGRSAQAREDEVDVSKKMAEHELLPWQKSIYLKQSNRTLREIQKKSKYKVMGEGLMLLENVLITIQVLLRTHLQNGKSVVLR